MYLQILGTAQNIRTTNFSALQTLPRAYATQYRPFQNLTVRSFQTLPRFFFIFIYFIINSVFPLSSLHCNTVHRNPTPSGIRRFHFTQTALFTFHSARLHSRFGWGKIIFRICLFLFPT